MQAPEEKRLVFRDELQRVGTEGAKVLRELESKVKKMERLSSGGDILLQVHQAAEDLQKKIDRNSYLLVNSESWGFFQQEQQQKKNKELDDSENIHDASDQRRPIVISSLSDMLDSGNPSTILIDPPPIESLSASSDSMMRRQLPSWPQLSFGANSAVNDPLEEPNAVYESASSLSLATFTSLLIEFVARLQNLVDAFQELCEKANFKEPVEVNVVDKKEGVWKRFLTFIHFTRSH